MEIKKTLKIISVAALALLLCPSAPTAFLCFAAGVIVFAFGLFRKTEFVKKSLVDSKKLFIAFFLNILLLAVFVIRWGEMLNPIVTALTGLFLSIIATPALPVIVECYSVKGNKIKLSDKKLLLKDHLVFLLFSAGILLLLSSASPLIPVNWDYDTNCIFTASRGLLHGKLIYRDLIEHKGTVLHLIYAAGALITPYGFTGLWLVEVVFCYLFMVISTKIQLLFVESKNLLNPVITGAVTMILYGCKAFYCGNTGEEFAILFVAVILYFCIRFVSENNINFTRTFAVGLCTSAIFWIKFNLCGTAVGVVVFFAVLLLIKKEFKSLLTAGAGVISGFAAVTVPIILFYIIRGGINDLINVYFIMNIFKYHIYSSNGSMAKSFLNPFLALPAHLANNNQLLVLIVTGLFFLYCRNKKLLPFFVTVLSFSFYFAFLGSENVAYYPFILTPFTIIGAVPVNRLITMITDGKKKALKFIAPFLSVILAALFCLPFIENKKYYGLPKEAYPSYTFTEIIKASDDQSFVCFDFIDSGFYTMMQVDPEVQYFSFLNADKDHIVNTQKEYIRDNDYNFIITNNDTEVFEGYELIKAQQNPFDTTDTFFLYQKAEG